VAAFGDPAAMLMLLDWWVTHELNATARDLNDEVAVNGGFIRYHPLTGGLPLLAVTKTQRPQPLGATTT
jgi:hypothetical protein